MSLRAQRNRVNNDTSGGEEKKAVSARGFQYPLFRLPPSTQAVHASGVTTATAPNPSIYPQSPASGQQATIDIWRGHWATLEPVVPEIHELLESSTLEFDVGGPLGHQMRHVLTWQLTPIIPHLQLDNDGRVVRPKVQLLPQGLVPDIVECLRELGYDVTIRDHREDSERWVRHDQWKKYVPKKEWKLLDAVAEQKALRVVGRGNDDIAESIAAVARAYPNAKIAVAVPTYKLLARITRRLNSSIREPLGLYTAKKKQAGRISVGLIGQFPRGNKGEFDLLVLPYAENTLSDNAVEIITSGQFRRILSFTRSRTTSDQNINQRLFILAGSVWPAERVRVPITAVFLDTHGTRPTAKKNAEKAKAEKMNAYEEKKQLYWHNTRRNKRIAEVAKCLVQAKKKAVRSIVNDTDLVKEIVCAAKTGVAILVETPVHARELAKLLPGWVTWTTSQDECPKRKSGFGVISTELAARETVISAGILIRAAGTKFPLPNIDWPWVGDVEEGVLIDFSDKYHSTAAKYAKLRMTAYEESGIIIVVQKQPEIAVQNT